MHVLAALWLNSLLSCKQRPIILQLMGCILLLSACLPLASKGIERKQPFQPAHLQSCNLWGLATHANSGAALVVLCLLTLQATKQAEEGGRKQHRNPLVSRSRA
jgi:hypothetical protein